MTGVYSRRRLVLVIALVVALLTSPLLAAGLGSNVDDTESQRVAAANNDLDDDLVSTATELLATETPTPTSTSTSTPTPTPTSSDSDGLTDELGDTLTDTEDTLTTTVDETDETLNDTDDTLTTVIDETNETVNDTVETLDDANETVNETVENTSDVIDNTVNETEKTLDGANETLDETEETLENESDEIEDTVDDADDVTVNVTVEDASAGEMVDVAVPSMEADVAFENLAIKVEREGGFELAFTSSRDRFTAPNLTGRPGTVALGYVRLEHTIADADVGNVTVTFGVDAEQFENTDLDPDDVALYRYSDGSWNELPTELVGQQDGRYVYSATSPGLSEFAAGAKQSSFEVPTVTVETGAVSVGDDVAVRVHVENKGGADGVYTATLSLDGEALDSRDVSVAAGGSRVLTFREAVESPGTYTVSINEIQAGEVSVQPAGTTAGPATPDEGAVAVRGQPGFGPVTALAALLAGGLFVLRWYD